ncbi:hypothetical protein QAD02_022519 [Eretmocerus hayati]|uniref:Uncharacterized protein n=1 Tax=Eretmocerus hayati TaxID=131215 RepID=A0ACC2PT06_9HYME|nr:hypothetical protein QAD02_022519 [Eretmocerus hayati]
MQKVNGALERIKDLKQKFVQALAALPTQVAVIPDRKKSRAELYPFVPSLRCKTKQELENLSVFLKTRKEDVVPQFTGLINNIGGKGSAAETRNIPSRVIADEPSQVLTWVIDRGPPTTADAETVTGGEPNLIVGKFDLFDSMGCEFHRIHFFTSHNLELSLIGFFHFAPVVVTTRIGVKNQDGKDLSTTLGATMTTMQEWFRRAINELQGKYLKLERRLPDELRSRRKISAVMKLKKAISVSMTESTNWLSFIELQKFLMAI